MNKKTIYWIIDIYILLVFGSSIPEARSSTNSNEPKLQLGTPAYNEQNQAQTPASITGEVINDQAQ